MKNIIKEGGYAFPVPTSDAMTVELTRLTGGDAVMAARCGMSLRDYFIAHAPAEPWAWYRPAMPPVPEPPKMPGDNAWEFTDEEHDRAETWWTNSVIGGAKTFPLTGSPRLDSFVAKWNEYWKLQSDHQADRIMQTSLQWPSFFADQMLVQRGIRFDK